MTYSTYQPTDHHHQPNSLSTQQHSSVNITTQSTHHHGTLNQISYSTYQPPVIIINQMHYQHNNSLRFNTTHQTTKPYTQPIDNKPNIAFSSTYQHNTLHSNHTPIISTSKPPSTSLSTQQHSPSQHHFSNPNSSTPQINFPGIVSPVVTPTS